MFNRLNKTYDYTPDVIQNILRDSANPLNIIAEIINDKAKVLDIGAGNGILASVLCEKNKFLVIDGIEPAPYATNLARKSYRHFYCGFAKNFKDKILREDYDFIVLADVIEHMNDPLDFLSDLVAGLPKKTKIILSIPNIAFGAVRLSLLNGEFNYVDSGILEKTHLRFFTLKTIEMLISNLNMNIEKLYFLQRNFLKTEINLKELKLNLFCLSNVLKDSLSSTYQFLLVLTKEQVTTEKKFIGEKATLSQGISIILNSWFRNFIKKSESQ